jgi:hypothetical protein
MTLAICWTSGLGTSSPEASAATRTQLAQRTRSARVST